MENKFYSKSKVLMLFKLKNQVEDADGYKTLQFKVIALCKNGTLLVFTPSDTNLMRDWQKQEVTNTPMAQAKDIVMGGFQN